MLNNLPKVSIITPCYNGEKYLHHFFESLLNQTYTNVEFIFINDGSTDNSSKIYKKYELLLINKGWECKYIYQNYNSGVASAINKGLEKFTGDYFIWPDCDDILYPDHIYEKVKYMEKHKEYGIAYSPFDIVDFKNISQIIGVKDFIPDNNMFYNIIDEKPLIWTLGTIIRTSAFLDVNPTRRIAECRGGQNCQIQMPILYKYPCGYINKSLSKYVIHNNSHSHCNRHFVIRRLDLLDTWFKSIFMIRELSLFRKIMLCFRVLLRNIFVLFKYFIQCIFSAQNKCGHKVITILGFKIKFKINKLPETPAAVERERERERESNPSNPN